MTDCNSFKLVIAMIVNNCIFERHFLFECVMKPSAMSYSVYKCPLSLYH